MSLRLCVSVSLCLCVSVSLRLRLSLSLSLTLSLSLSVGVLCVGGWVGLDGGSAGLGFGVRDLRSGLEGSKPYEPTSLQSSNRAFGV